MISSKSLGYNLPLQDHISTITEFSVRSVIRKHINDRREPHEGQPQYVGESQSVKTSFFHQKVSDIKRTKPSDLFLAK